MQFSGRDLNALNNIRPGRKMQQRTETVLVCQRFSSQTQMYDS